MTFKPLNLTLLYILFKLPRDKSKVKKRQNKSGSIFFSCVLHVCLCTRTGGTML